MKRRRIFILAVLCTCLMASDIFAVKMVENRKPTQAAPSEIKAKQETAKTGLTQPGEKTDAAVPYPLRGPGKNTAPEEATSKPRKSAQYVTMDFDGVDITMLIKFIADLTKKNFIVDSGVSGKVTVISPRKMTVGEAYKVFESVLEVNGLTTVPMNGVIKIMKSADAMTKGVETKLGATASKRDKLVTQIIPLKYADADEMKNLLTPLMGKGASQLLSYPQSNLLIVTDTLSNIKKILDIIKVVDVKGFAQDIKIIPLTHASASDLSTKLTQIITGASQTGGAAPSARRMPGGGSSSKQSAQIIAYERTNALIVMATTQEIRDIENLVKQLDIPTPSGKEDIHVYYLQYASAEDVAKVLSAVPAPTSPEATPSAGVTTPQRATATTTQQQSFKISPDKSTNSLIIFADSYTYNNVVETIKYLDIPRKQVYVKAVIMEVNTTKDFTLGVEWSAMEDFKYDHGDRTGGVFGRTGSTFYSSLADLPTGPLLGVIGDAITLNVGGTEVTFPNITSFINAMAQDKDVKIISTPQIITLDNKQAEIKVGKNVPYLTKTDTDSTNINRTVNTYDYRDVGVNLKITPQINQQGNVRMELFEEITQLVAGTGEDVYAPTTLKRSATTTVMVKDGTTMVIAGLIGETLTASEYRVPLLGRIPVLGWLFKTVNKDREKTNLYIFLTPIIIDTDEKANALYKEKYGQITKMKQAFDKSTGDEDEPEAESFQPTPAEKKDESAPAEVKPELGQPTTTEKKDESAPTEVKPELGQPATTEKKDESAPTEVKPELGQPAPAPDAKTVTPETKPTEGKGDAHPQP